MDTTTLATIGAGLGAVLAMLALTNLAMGFWDSPEGTAVGLLVGLSLVLICTLLGAPRVEADDAHAKALTTAYLARLGHTLKGDVLCTYTSFDWMSEGWSCSAATEPNGLVVTLHCGTRRCVVPVR